MDAMVFFLHRVSSRGSPRSAASGPVCKRTVESLYLYL